MGLALQGCHFPVGRMERRVIWDEGGGEEKQAGLSEKAERMKLNTLNLVKMKNFPLTLFFVRLRFINHGLVLIALENPVCIACLAFLFRWSSPGGWWSLGHPLSCNAFAGTVPARRLGHPLSEDGSLPISLYHLNSNKSLELPCSNKNMLLFGRAGKICKWEIKSAVYTSCISVWNSISKLFQCWK